LIYDDNYQVKEFFRCFLIKEERGGGSFYLHYIKNSPPLILPPLIMWVETKLQTISLFLLLIFL